MNMNEAYIFLLNTKYNYNKLILHKLGLGKKIETWNLSRKFQEKRKSYETNSKVDIYIYRLTFRQSKY